MSENPSPATEALRTVHSKVGELLDEAAAVRHYEVPETSRRILQSAATAITDAHTGARSAKARAKAFLADDTLYPDGRKRLSSETIAEAQASADRQLADAEVKMHVAEANLYEAARPKLQRNEGAVARMDAQMLLDAAYNRDGGDLTEAVGRLAARQDAVGALVASGWLDDWAMARGIPHTIMEPLKTVLRQHTIEAAADSNDPERAAAARAYLAIQSMRKAHATAANAVRMTLY